MILLTIEYIDMKKPTVLIVEDDVDLLSTLTDLLEGEGVNVVGIDRCKEVEKFVQKTHPDVALLDIKLPDGRGDVLAEKIKQINGTKVYLMSASEELHKMTKDAGADGYLKKPFGFQEVLDLIS